MVSRMVTTRPTPQTTIGAPFHTANTTLRTPMQNPQHVATNNSKQIRPPGFITWHLYAAHASIEHRLNRAPHIAARIYELGLRRHRTFLSTPPYVLAYASLLMELNDEENLRSLLTRAVAACEEEEIGEGVVMEDAMGVTRGGTSIVLARKREEQRPLWDAMLRFESILACREGGDPSIIREVEGRRRRALYGSGLEDVTSGVGLAGIDSTSEAADVGIGIHKSTLSETLVRTDGYDVSSRIINGLGRLVDTLEVTGMWGDGPMTTMSSSSSMDALAITLRIGSVWNDDGAGGRSDASYRRRLRMSRENALTNSLGLTLAGGSIFSGVSANALSGGVGGSASATSGKFLTARERFIAQQNPSQNTLPGVGAPTTAGAAAAAMAAAQRSPEWLKKLILMLPPTPRTYRGAPMSKPPPHMIEMALVALRDSTLPSVRPSDDNGINHSAVAGNSSLGARTKRRVGDYDGGDSSDDEGGALNSGGYGSQFRARQRARMMTTALPSS